MHQVEGTATRKRTPRAGWTRLDNELVTRGFLATLSGIETKVYLALRVHMNDRLECWPGRRHLAQEVGRHWTSISGAVRGLAEKGFITIRSVVGRSNVYTIRTLQEVMKTRSKTAIGKTRSKTATRGIVKTLRGDSDFATGGIAKTLPELDTGKQTQEQDPKKKSATRYARPRSSSTTSSTTAEGKPTPASKLRGRPPTVKDNGSPPVTLPEGFAAWLIAYNTMFDLVPPRAYLPTRGRGPKFAALYAAALTDGFTQADLLAVLPVAKRQHNGGFRTIRFPNVVLTRVGDLLAEAASIKGQEGGRRVEPPGFCHSPTRWS